MVTGSAGAYDRIAVKPSPGAAENGPPRWRVTVQRPGDETHAPTLEHLENMTRMELEALGDHIFATLYL